MKRPLSSLFPMVALLGAAFAACHKPSTDSSAPTPSVSDAADDVPDDGDGGTPGSGGGGHKARARKEKEPKKEKEKEGDAGRVPTGDASTVPGTFKIAINKPTPEPMAPPSLRKAAAIPALPNLPAKDKYPKEAKIPKPPENGSCGQVWTGTEFVGIDCTPGEVHDKHVRVAKVVVPYTRLKQPADKLPKIVDHRQDGTEGIVRQQGGVECSAFALTAALDHAYARWTGTPAEFSVMQVWGRYHKVSETVAASANVGDLLAPESEWPYDKALSASWASCGKDAAKKKAVCGKPVDEEKLKGLDKHALAEITQIEVIDHPELELLKEKLAAGQDATVGLKLHSFATAGDAGAKYIIGAPPEKGQTADSHDVVIAGYAATPNGTYYLIHNSFGTHWGDQGYAWLHEDILKGAWITRAMKIPDVEPLQVARVRARAHGLFGEKCEAGKVPDSISGLCAARCSDGGPRHNNVCPDEKKNECPVGHVNLTGECVLSAPKSTGAEGNIKWDCAASGCTYEVPKGELECKEKECQISCPAPDFRLATTPKGLVCVE